MVLKHLVESMFLMLVWRVSGEKLRGNTRYITVQRAAMHTLFFGNNAFSVRLLVDILFM